MSARAAAAAVVALSVAVIVTAPHPHDVAPTPAHPVQSLTVPADAERAPIVRDAFTVSPAWIPCASEDAAGACVWHAPTRGNLAGRSFYVDASGVLVHVDDETAAAMLVGGAW